MAEERETHKALVQELTAKALSQAANALLEGEVGVELRGKTQCPSDYTHCPRSYTHCSTNYSSDRTA